MVAEQLLDFEDEYATFVKLYFECVIDLRSAAGSKLDVQDRTDDELRAMAAGILTEVLSAIH